ncbi:MAG: PD40 domain-containing protein [Flavobacteriales bacterium]|nr:PD40 domain-containing protein [Flavobacteriales bacterium]MCB9193308.1 PD40 domain-containing protein [Flavobacteriales bacterium]
MPDRSRTRAIASLIAILALCVPALRAQFYNGAQQEFGKNRVQYQDFLWQYYRFDRMETYFYKGGRDIARYVALSAHKHLKELEKELDISIDDRIQFIVYNSMSDLRQSNIGITGDEQYNIGGVTRIVGTKVFVYYEGDHDLLDQQVRSGIAQVLIDQMMYGGNWREVLKNSTLLNLPEWFTKGLVAHVSGPMNALDASRLRDGILTGRFDKFNRLEGDDAVLVGQAIWNYVADVYGSSVIPNILYMTRVSRNPESGFLYVLGIPLRTLSKECLAYYKDRFGKDDHTRKEADLQELPIRTRKNTTYAQFMLSPDGRYAAYTSNEMGQYKVWLYDIAAQKRKKLIKGEKKLDRIVDRSYPVLAWHPGSKALSFAVERKGELYLKTYTLDDHRTTTHPVFMLDKILGMDYSPDGRNMIFSGVVDGRTDLYYYYLIGNRQEQLTNDPYDDLDPRFVNEGRSIIFTSDRPDDTLRVLPPSGDVALINGNKDVFLFDLATRSPILKRLTDTPSANEVQPAQYDSVNYTYLSDADGTMDRYLVRYDSAIARIDTSIHYRYYARERRITGWQRAILEQSVRADRGRFAQLMFEGGRYRFQVGAMQEAGEDGGPRSGGTRDEAPPERLVNGVVTNDMTPVVKVDAQRPDVPDQERVDIRNYVFSDESSAPRKPGDQPPSEAPGPRVATVSHPTTDSLASKPLQFPEQRNYNVNFATDAVLTQVDNSYSGEFYQPFTGPGNLNPGLSALMQMGISDLFEDYKIVGGIRLALSLNNFDYSLSYENLRHRLDRKIILQRQTLQGVSDIGVVKVQTHQAIYQLSWPFSELASLRTTLLYRNDRYVLQSTDLGTLQTPNHYENQLGARLAYVYDSSIPLGLNLYTGWKAKVFGEYYQQPDVKQSDMAVFGLDIRHSLRVHRDMIWVNRLAGSTSLGNRRVIFFLGGVDNWLFPKVDNTIPIDFDQNYYFQANATPMRGFYYNARNGTSFGVFNTELRFPVFRYLLDRPIRSDFLQNFQLVGFGDAGVAWTGSDPYSEDNTFNQQVVHHNPLTITIKNQREPILSSFGFGIRTRLLGYFVRADAAWGIDDGVILDPLVHISLSLDI